MATLPGGGKRPSRFVNSELRERLGRYAAEWRVDLSETLETGTSLIAFGAHQNQSVVLKVTKQTGDEWHSGEVLQAFNGQGFVRVYEHAGGAVLLERLVPGNSLAEWSGAGRDEATTEILAEVIARMSNVNPPARLSHCPAVDDWARGFEWYQANGQQQIPRDLVETGQKEFLELCASQGQRRLLHGDLQHYNVLFDAGRGWLAIDPKGVFGELEYEVGAIMRNPVACPELFLRRSTVERRLEVLATRLNLNYERALRWTFAQAVLSAIWEIEDRHRVDESSAVVRLADTVRTMIADR